MFLFFDGTPLNVLAKRAFGFDILKLSPRFLFLMVANRSVDGTPLKITLRSKFARTPLGYCFLN